LEFGVADFGERDDGQGWAMSGKFCFKGHVAKPFEEPEYGS
jgi:hypothetical protein